MRSPRPRSTGSSRRQSRRARATLQVELGGQAVEQAQQASLGFATIVGIGAAILILLLSFGSFSAMGLPIATALVGLGTGVGVITLASHVVAMPDFASELALMIGLGVGVDYALFIVTRFRENYRRNGGDVQQAVEAAMTTSGRAVVFAGATVVIALLGHVRARRERAQRRGGGRRDRRGAGPQRIADAAARAAQLRRAPGRRGPRTELGSGDAGGQARLLAAVGASGAAAPGAHRGRRHSADARYRGAGARPAPCFERRRQRPGEPDDAPRVRPAGKGLRPGLQRAAPGRRGTSEGSRHGGTHAADPLRAPRPPGSPRSPRLG